MSIYVAFLQGVNVGKHKRIKMDAFHQIIIDLGGTYAKTVANSGNIVFAYGGDLEKEGLRGAIEKAVSDLVGQPVPTLIRTDEEMRQVVANNPYPQVTDPKCLHVEFLNQPVPDALNDLAFGEDHLTLIGCEIYLHAPNKMSGITYDARTLYKRLGKSHTSRNWNTIKNVIMVAEFIARKQRS